MSSLPFRQSFLPNQGPQPRQKLEDYARLYTQYTNTIQHQGDVMRHDTQRMQEAYNQVAAEFNAEQYNFARNTPGASYVLADLNEYARRCTTIRPESFQDRVRIAFAASGFVQILMNFVIGELNTEDMEWVLARATQLRSSNPDQPIPTFAPARCKLKPDNAVNIPVTTLDIARWRSRPRELIGKCFVTTEAIMRRTFLVQDYYVKRDGPRYDVVYEDTGLGVLHILDPRSVLTMVKDAELLSAA